MDWRAEIIELHALFDAWFQDGTTSLERFESTLDPAFTLVSPSGVVAGSSEIVEAVRSGGGRAPGQSISTSDHELLVDDGDIVVARYAEHQRTEHASTRRWSTVVFVRDDAQPNGVRWLTVHETWAPETAG